MVPSVTINGYNFAQWATEGGISVEPFYRRQKSVVANDGTEYRTQAERWKIQISFLDVNEDTLETMKAYLYGSLVSVTENVTVPGTTSQWLAYQSGLTYSPKKVKGGQTDFTGLSLTLEQM